jgi:hypothetical protein
MALKRPPSRITPASGVPDVYDFPRDVQPILDRHCVSCHGYDQRRGGVVLTGDRGPVYSHSYFALTVRDQLADGRNKPQSNYAPRSIGSSASAFLKKLEPGHHGVQTTPHERTIARLWIETGAPYPGTYAALGTGMIGSYTENELDRSDLAWPSAGPAMEALHRRCNSCHSAAMPLPMTASDDQKLPPWEGLKLADIRRRFSRHILYNLSRPDKSVLLLAPLAREAGGFGSCRQPVFKDTSDPDYRKILTYITDAKAKLDEMKRFDMPGFIPRRDWTREMQRFGLLPADHDPAKAVDYYAVERAYWRSLWYQPR